MHAEKIGGLHGVVPKPITQQLDYVGGANPIYIGAARPGSLTSDPVWQIKKLSYSGSDVTAIQFANGSPDYSSVWDNRASYTYS